MPGWLRLIAPLVCVICLSACLPEDTFLALRFSPDGQLLAVVSEKRGLIIADPAGMETRDIAPGNIDPGNVTWTSDSMRVAYAGSRGESLDIFLSSLDGMTTRITSSPSRETNPIIRDNIILYLTTESGQSALTSHSLQPGGSANNLTIPQMEGGLIGPELSPDARFIAAFTFQDIRPQLLLLDLTTGAVDRLTSETDPFSLVIDSLTWKNDSTAIGFLRGKPTLIHDGADDEIGKVNSPVGTIFNSLSLKRGAEEHTLVRMAEGIRGAKFEADGSVVFSSEDQLMLSPPSGTDRVLAMDFSTGLPETGGDGGEIAFVAAEQLIGITTASLERVRILTFDLQDKFLLAEEYFRSGSRSKSYDLYEELAASVKRTRDPEMARFIYIANLRRLGRTDKAVKEIETLLAEGQPSSVPEKYLWRVLGFSYLLELNDFEKAASSFEHYRELTSGTQKTSSPDSAINALQIIRQTSPEITRLYASAVKARLDGNFNLTDQRFGDLLTSVPLLPAVQHEYLNALNGFDSEVYYFSPSQRPFRPTPSQRVDYIQRFVNAVPAGSSLARDARLNLFLLRIEMGSYSRARALLNEALTSAPAMARPEGILEVFHNFLETPEPQPWINQAMPEVFLHSQIRPRLENMITDRQDHLLMAVAATKVALLQNAPDDARREADTAAAIWNKIPSEKQSGETAILYGRLLVLRAREAELRGLYSEASERYDQAVKLLAAKHTDNFEMQEEIRYRGALLRMLVGNYPNMIQRMRDIELRTGAELINPTWDEESLQSAVREYLDIYDSTSSTLKQWVAYEVGVHLSKLGKPYQARSAMRIACSDSAPEFLRRKAMLELAAIDEYVGDPWNAARWFGRLAALPGVEADVRLWCSYQIARLHLSINYRVEEARDALALIVSMRLDGDLAVRARQLLVTTGGR